MSRSSVGPTVDAATTSSGAGRSLEMCFCVSAVTPTPHLAVFRLYVQSVTKVKPETPAPAFETLETHLTMFLEIRTHAPSGMAGLCPTRECKTSSSLKSCTGVKTNAESSMHLPVHIYIYVCVNIYKYVCMSVLTHMYIYIYVSMHVCMHACIHAWMDGWMDGWMDVCISLTNIARTVMVVVI